MALPIRSPGLESWWSVVGRWGLFLSSFGDSLAHGCFPVRRCEEPVPVRIPEAVRQVTVYSSGNPNVELKVRIKRTDVPVDMLIQLVLGNRRPHTQKVVAVGCLRRDDRFTLASSRSSSSAVGFEPSPCTSHCVPRTKLPYRQRRVDGSLRTRTSIRGSCTSSKEKPLLAAASSSALNASPAM